MPIREHEYMKITIGQLRQVIAEEVSKALSEAPDRSDEEVLKGYLRLYARDKKSYDDAMEMIQFVVNKEAKAAYDNLGDDVARQMWDDLTAEYSSLEKQMPEEPALEKPGVDRDDWRSSPGARYSRMKKSDRRFYGPGGRPRY
jgi:hypothetical protein